MTLNLATSHETAREICVLIRLRDEDKKSRPSDLRPHRARRVSERSSPTGGLRLRWAACHGHGEALKRTQGRGMSAVM